MIAVIRTNLRDTSFELLTKGQEIDGRYRLFHRIGEGGMAEVWMAEQIALHRKVAIKFISTRGPKADRQVKRFLREAMVAAAVRHRHVIEILDYGMAEDGGPFMVMELLDGENLSQRLVRSSSLTLRECLDRICEALSGLAAVHDAGVVHRDIKPSNIFLVADADGEYSKLVDFGVSRRIVGERDELGAPLTEDGAVVGTLQYMSPEQARGESIDARSDLYGIGLVTYEAVTGRRPFSSLNLASVLADIAAGDVAKITSVRSEAYEPLSEVVTRAMAPLPKDRHQNARELRAALEDAISALPAQLLDEPLKAQEVDDPNPHSLGLSSYISGLCRRPALGRSSSMPKGDEALPKQRTRLLLIVGVAAILIALSGILIGGFSPPTMSISSVDDGSVPASGHGLLNGEEAESEGEEPPLESRRAPDESSEAMAENADSDEEASSLSTPADPATVSTPRPAPRPRTSTSTSRRGSKARDRNSKAIRENRPDRPPEGQSQGSPGELIRDLGF